MIVVRWENGGPAFNPTTIKTKQHKTELRNTISCDKESGHALGRKRMKADLPRKQNRQSSWTAPTQGQPPQPSLPKGDKVKQEEQEGREGGPGGWTQAHNKQMGNC